MTGPPTIEIRPVRPAEHARVADLVAGEYARLFVLGAYEAALRDVAARAAQTDVLVAVAGGAVVGTVTYVRGPGAYAEADDPAAGHVRMLAVDPAARGRGIGEALVRACLARAAASGRARVVLHTTDGMLAARRLYERLGFERRPDLDWEDDGLAIRGFSREVTAADRAR